MAVLIWKLACHANTFTRRCSTHSRHRKQHATHTTEEASNALFLEHMVHVWLVHEYSFSCWI